MVSPVEVEKEGHDHVVVHMGHHQNLKNCDTQTVKISVGLAEQ